MTSAKPSLWQSIATTLSGEISQGHYRPGDKLPTEQALALRFGVNRHTVRHALAAMADQGAVQARRGSGVFVTAHPTTYPIGRRVRFGENVMAMGQTPSRTITRTETRIASAREAETLALAEPAMVHVVEGISFADNTPLAVFRSVFPAQMLPGFLAAMQDTGSITAALIREGITDYTRASTAITAKLAPATMAAQLRIPTGAPILRAVAVNIDPAGIPVEYGTTWFAGDRVALTVNSA